LYSYKPVPLYIKPLQLIYCLYASITFIICLLIVIPGVVIASFFGRLKGGNFIYHLCRGWVDVWLPAIGIFHNNIYDAPIDKNKQYVFISNHISYMDIPVIFRGIRKSHFRILAKIEMSRIPIFGFLYKNATVMVDRSDSSNRQKSVDELRNFMTQGISIFIYPEGTFNMGSQPLKSFYDGAFRMAIEMQTPLKPVVFIDTVDRLHYHSILSLTPGISRAVILADIPVAGLTMSDLPALKQTAFDAMQACLLKYRK
jgi:1-acyl-sn-glycerol-3-phosphate acyltransferase